jgi:rSAM/selenodomain-associated transferase 1
MKSPDLILFAKQPVPGQVKTRLQVHCSPQRAAEIMTFLIEATVETAVSFWPSTVYLYAWPDAEHPLFRRLADTYHVKLATQAAGDLGEKMYRAMADGIERSGAAAIMGCDTPQCRWDIFEQAHELLARGKETIGLSKDGGYYLLGLQQADVELFQDMAWGSRTTGPATVARLEAMGRYPELLPTLQDIDTWEDLREVARDYASLQRFL